MTNGRAIAMTVAGLLMAAAPSVQAEDKPKAKEAKVKCAGINSCQGKGACGGATNGCAGQNSCKGKGWIEVTAKECQDQKGTVVADKAKDAKDTKAKDTKKK